MRNPIEDLTLATQVEPSRRREAFVEACRWTTEVGTDVRVAAAEAIAATGNPDEALAALQKMLHDETFAVRIGAAAAIAGTPWRGRLDVLASVLDDKETSLAFVAADGLAHAGDKRCVDVLLRFAAVRTHRFGALDSLLALNDPAIVPLAKRLASAFFTNPYERALAAIVLSAEGDQAARKRLRERLAKRNADERPFIVVHLASVDPGEGRRAIEAIANDVTDDMHESALLALAKIDPAWWAPATKAVLSGTDPRVAAELLLGLFDVDAHKAELLVPALAGRDDSLGEAARRIRLQAALRREFPAEVLLRCD